MPTWISYQVQDEKETRTTHLNLDRMYRIYHVQYADPDDNELQIAYDFAETQFLIVHKRAKPDLYEKLLAYLAEHSHL